MVAVVGAGHCQGMKDNWDVEIALAEITRMPPKEDWDRTRRVVLYGGGALLTGTVLTVVCGCVCLAVKLPVYLRMR